MEFISHASGSTGNLYQILSRSGQSLLIDPGLVIAKIRKLLNFKIHTVSAALVSHSHGDHSKGVLALTKAGVDCYMTEPTAKALKITGHRCHIIEGTSVHKVGDFQFVAFPTHHDCPGSVGFLISDGYDKLLFVTDSLYIHNRFEGLDIIAVECNYSDELISSSYPSYVKKRLYQTHFDLKNVLEFLRETDLSRVREIHLLHLSSTNSDARAFKRAVEQITGRPTYAHGG